MTESKSLRIRSTNSDAAIEFSNVDGEDFFVAVSAADHSARRQVWAYTDGRGIARIFSEAATEWRGWEGKKTWQSLEGEFRLDLSSDKLGHVTLSARLSSNGGTADGWLLQADISIDAGQLDSIARNANDLWPV